MERVLLVSAEELMVQFVQAKQQSSPARATTLMSNQNTREQRFALLFLHVLISLFQLMFPGCALREVRTVGRESWCTDDKSHSHFCHDGMTGGD